MAGLQYPFGGSVRLAYHRWAIERFHHDGQHELGLGDDQARTWPGLHRQLAVDCLDRCYTLLAADATAARAFPCYTIWPRHGVKYWGP